jgi:hypothetical protein
VRGACDASAHAVCIVAHQAKHFLLLPLCCAPACLLLCGCKCTLKHTPASRQVSDGGALHAWLHNVSWLWCSCRLQCRTSAKPRA